MKRLLATFSFMLAFTAFTFAQTPTNDNPNAPEFQWAEDVHDFGNIPQGIPVSHRFEFTNTGNEPLIITDVKKTCGCTVTNFTKEPILPGQSGFVDSQFKAAKEGNFNKAITVMSNAKTPNVKLFFKGKVEPKAKEDNSGVPANNSIFTPKN